MKLASLKVGFKVQALQPVGFVPRKAKGYVETVLDEHCIIAWDLKYYPLPHNYLKNIEFYKRRAFIKRSLISKNDLHLLRIL